MMDVVYVSGFTGTLKSSTIKEFINIGYQAFYSPTKFILKLDRYFPRHMIEPTSMHSFYAQSYLLSNTQLSNKVVIERGLWDYLGYHYVWAINGKDSIHLSSIDIKGLYDEYRSSCRIDKGSERVILLYNNCDRLIEIIKNSPEIGRNIAFNENGDVDYYKGCQKDFISICEYILSSLEIPYEIKEITDINF